MNENINLCKILKGLEGIELYSTVYGTVTLQRICGNGQLVLIYHRTLAEDSTVIYEPNGKLLNIILDDECTLFPSKTQRDWSKFERPIPIDTPMMISFDTDKWQLAFYWGYNKSKNYHLVLLGTNKCHISYKEFCKNKSGKIPYMIPFDKFNPNNIEESLKYNIQK